MELRDALIVRGSQRCSDSTWFSGRSGCALAFTRVRARKENPGLLSIDPRCETRYPAVPCSLEEQAGEIMGIELT